jgi:6-phosphogluconate dehydrogenase (decarboxylating)
MALAGQWMGRYFNRPGFAMTGSSISALNRMAGRSPHTFAERVLSAMRQKFGGHIERPTGG